MDSTTPTSRRSIVEKFGLEAVPIESQTTPWYRFVFIQIAISANAGNFILPALAVLEGGLTFLEAIIATCIGAFVAFMFVSLLSIPGARYGIPSQYAIRAMIGVKGARYLSSPIRSLTSLYWFSVQTIGGTYVLQQLILKLTGNNLPFLMFSIPLSIIMALLATIGFEAVKQATTYFLPLLLVGEAVMLYLYFTTETVEQSSVKLLDFSSNGSISVMFFYASLVFIQYVSGVSASADMTRYAKSPRQGAWGLFVGNSIGFILTAVIGAGSAFLTSELNPYVSTSQLTGLALLIGLITLTALISMLSINMSNAYTGGYSLLNTFSKLSRLQSAIIFGVLGVLCSSFPALVYEAEFFISALGGFIIPISAVIVVDFIFIKKLKLTHVDLESLTKSASINMPAIATVLVGSISYFLLPNELSPGFLTFLFVSILYPIALKLKKIVKTI